MRAVEEVATVESIQQQSSQAALERRAQEVDRQQERLSLAPVALGRNPSFTGRVPATGGDDEVDMRMPPEVTLPGVQHRELADLAAQEPRVSAQMVDGVAGGAHERAKHDRREGGCQAAQVARQRQHGVKVAAGKQLFHPRRHPCGALAALAVRTAPVAAGVGCQSAIPAVVADLHVQPARHGAARGDRFERAVLIGREPGAQRRVVAVGKGDRADHGRT